MNRVLGFASLVAILLVPIGLQRSRGATTTTPACVARSAVPKWSTPELIAQTLAVPVDQASLSAARGVVAGGVGGVLLTGTSPSNLGAAVAALKAAETIPPIVMTDEEGGAVQRLSAVVGNLPSARQMGSTMSPSAITALAHALGKKMVALGITMDLAPVLDADGGAGPSATDPDGTRSFSANVLVALRDGVAFAEGLEAAGVTPVLKHFPGLGGSSGNTDFEVASTRPWSTLSTGGLLPFADAVRDGLPAVMVADAVVPGLTSVPAALSPSVVTAELRRHLGFKGLILSDSLTAPSIANAGFPLAAATVDTLKAGVDMVLFDSSSANLATNTSSLIGSVTTAVGHHVLTRARLITAATEVLSVKGALCPVRAS